MATTALKKEVKQAVQVKTETIKGVVTRRIFFNPDNNYVVLSIDTDSGQIKASGYMASVREGDEYKFTGVWTSHPKYGDTFKFISSELILPIGTAGVARYLSGITAGVGMAKAQKIVDVLGENCLEMIRENPEILNKLDFLNETQRREIAEDLSKNSVQAELAGMICRDGIGQGMVSRIMAKYGNDAVRVVKENPYVLADELWGVGFRKADAIAQAVGIALNSPYRVEAALNYILQEAGNEGHVYLEPNDIVRKLIGKGGLLECSGVGIPDIAQTNGKLIADGRCVREGDAVYAKNLYIAECAVAKAVRRLIGTKVTLPAGVNLDAMIDNVEKSMNKEVKSCA